MAELLGGALTGGGTGRVPYEGKKRVLNGMLSILIDPEKFGTSEHFQSEIEGFLGWLHEAPTAAGFDKMRTAGEPEREWKKKRLKDGIPVDMTTWAEIIAAAEKVGLKGADVAKIAGV